MLCFAFHSSINHATNFMSISVVYRIISLPSIFRSIGFTNIFLVQERERERENLINRLSVDVLVAQTPLEPVQDAKHPFRLLQPDSLARQKPVADIPFTFPL
jgi:hypothetical protein